MDLAIEAGMVSKRKERKEDRIHFGNIMHFIFGQMNSFYLREVGHLYFFLVTFWPVGVAQHKSFL